MLLLLCGVMTPTERKRLIGRIDDEIRDLNDGPLCKFPLFNEVAALTPGVYESPPKMSKIETAKAKEKLGKKLINMVWVGDDDSLFKVARTVRHFIGKLEKPVGKDRMHPQAFEERHETLKFFREHVDEDWTLEEIHEHLEKETGVRMERRRLKRWCKDYGFPVRA